MTIALPIFSRRFARSIAAVSLLALMVAGVGVLEASPNFKRLYSSRFGVMGLSPEGKYRVFAETTQIHRLVDQSYVHGFEVARKDGLRFMGQYSVRFPAPIKVTPELEKAFTVKEGGLLIESPAELHWGVFSSPFWFSEGDPLGRYTLKVMIDGELYRTFEYDVIPFGDEKIEF